MNLQETDLYASIVNFSDDAIISKNLDGTIVTWNKGAERMFGYEAGEIVGKHISKLLPEYLQNENKVIVERIRKGGVIDHYETERMHKNGKCLHVSLSISPVKDRDGKIIGAAKILRDMTESKRLREELRDRVAYTERRAGELAEVLLKYTLMDFSQNLTVSSTGDEWDAIALGLNTLNEELQSNMRQLKESEEKFNKAFQASPAGIILTRLSDQKFVDANEAICSMLGYTYDEIIGRTSIDLGLIAEPALRQDILGQMQRTGSAKNIEMVILNKTKEEINTIQSMSTVSLYGKTHIINIIYDITEKKTAEKRILQLNKELGQNVEQLKNLNKELEAFTYSVSHDLRAPLRAIDGYADMLGEDYKAVLDEEGKRLLSVVQFNAKRMGSLIDDLLSFSRLGRKDVQKTQVDMKQLTEGALREVSKFVRHNARITIGKLHPAPADYALMTQVMVNLISNGIKYTSRTTGPRIDITSKQKDGEIIYAVTDNGVGFNMEYAHKLFGVFQRLHRQEEFEGTGVGLAIVQRIIHKHGGKVWAEGKPNAGAKFYFSLPITT